MHTVASLWVVCGAVELYCVTLRVVSHMLSTVTDINGGITPWLLNSLWREARKSFPFHQWSIGKKWHDYTNAAFTLLWTMTIYSAQRSGLLIWVQMLRQKLQLSFLIKTSWWWSSDYINLSRWNMCPTSSFPPAVGLLDPPPFNYKNTAGNTAWDLSLNKKCTFISSKLHLLWERPNFNQV